MSRLARARSGGVVLRLRLYSNAWVRNPTRFGQSSRRRRRKSIPFPRLSPWLLSVPLVVASRGCDLAHDAGKAPAAPVASELRPVEAQPSILPMALFA